MRQLTLTRRPAESPGWRDCFELNRALTRLDSADRIARFVAENVRSFNAVNVATACHLLAKMHSQARRLRNRMQSRGQSGGEGRDVGQAFLALLARASVTVDSFKPQNVANLMWALATLGVEPGAELATAMSRRAVAIAGEFNLQDVANLMWALAVFSCEERDCRTLWTDTILHLLAALRRKPWLSLTTDIAAEVKARRQLHQVFLCVVLEGFLPGLDLAGQAGPNKVGVCRLACDGAAATSSNLQVGSGR